MNYLGLLVSLFLPPLTIDCNLCCNVNIADLSYVMPNYYPNEHSFIALPFNDVSRTSLEDLLATLWKWTQLQSQPIQSLSLSLSLSLFSLSPFLLILLKQFFHAKWQYFLLLLSLLLLTINCFISWYSHSCYFHRQQSLVAITVTLETICQVVGQSTGGSFAL